MNISISEIAAIIGGLIGLAGLGIGIWEFGRKTDLEIFLAYSKKYHEIITSDNRDKWNKACKSENPKHWEGMDNVAIEYLNLAWEEIYLHQTGVIRRNIWKIWWPEIKEVLETKFADSMMEKHDFHYLKAHLNK